MREYSEGSKEEKANLEKRYGRQQLQRLVDNALSEAWVTGNSQKCPHCNVSIEVVINCDKMRQFSNTNRVIEIVWLQQDVLLALQSVLLLDLSGSSRSTSAVHSLQRQEFEMLQPLV